VLQAVACPALVIVCLAASAAFGQEKNGLDTTRVRETHKVKKGFGATLADIPGEVLKLPVRTVRLLGLAATSRPISHLTDLINFAAPARPYVPVVGYSHGAGVKFGFGLRKLTKRFWDDRLDFSWYYSSHDYQSYQFRYKVRETLVDWIGIDFHYRYKKRTREGFYGVGMETPEEYEANYTLESSEATLDLPFRTDERFAVGVTSGFLLSNLSDGRDPDRPGTLDSLMADRRYALTPGRLDGSRWLRLGLILEYDGRDNGGQPSRGFHVLSRWVRYLGTGRSEDMGYYEAKVDIQHYLDVWRKRILATRLYLQRFDADNSNQLATPINLISRLGGAEGLRAFSSSRFIDNDLVLASVEWRFPVWKILDGFIFVDGGRVYEKITRAPVFRDWKGSYGVGFRVWNIQEVSFSTTFAFGEEGTRVYVASSMAW